MGIPWYSALLGCFGVALLSWMMPYLVFRTVGHLRVRSQCLRALKPALDKHALKLQKARWDFEILTLEFRSRGRAGSGPIVRIVVSVNPYDAPYCYASLFVGNLREWHQAVIHTSAEPQSNVAGAMEEVRAALAALDLNGLAGR